MKGEDRIKYSFFMSTSWIYDHFFFLFLIVFGIIFTFTFYGRENHSGESTESQPVERKQGIKMKTGFLIHRTLAFKSLILSSKPPVKRIDL